MFNSSTLPLYRRITQFLVSTTAILVLVCGGISTALAGSFKATDKDPKPADLFFNIPRVTFDCTALDTFELSPGLIDTLQGDTTDGPTEIPGYNCTEWPQAGPENIYQLNVNTELEFWAGLSNMGDMDLDIFLLNSCDTDSCLVGANTELSIVLEPGITYYLIVDGYGTSTANAGPYTLTYETRWIGLPPAVCEPGYADPISCGGESSTRSGSLFEQPNHVQVYDCSPVIERGGEAWFAVTLDPFHEFTATATPLAATLDPAIWIFDGCGNTAECLNFADDATGGLPESMRWVNDSETPLTLYLALDCYRAPTFDGAGAYEIEFTCLSNVATEKTSWGSIRSNFR